MRTINPTKVDLQHLIEKGIEFHGHLGPFLVLGIRMGLAALRELGSTGYSGINVKVETGTTPPVSCLIDGIQMSTGCTMGKGNIVTEPLGMPLATFSFEGKNMTFKVTDSILERIRNLDDSGIEDFAWAISKMPESDIIEMLRC